MDHWRVEHRSDLAVVSLPRATLADSIKATRRRDVPVIFVRIAFNPAEPVVSARNKSFTALNATLSMSEGDDATGQGCRS